ncbi:MAG: DUF5063 domain-containing protein [Muribaculaceae bacterium]|nr:DUF5063 domain-containing protein [Muribaculaceae bacterium]
MENQNVSTAAIGLVGLAVEYCRLIDNASQSDPQTFVRDILRYLPRFYITLSDLSFLDGDTEENGAICQIMEEDSYDAARQAMAAVFGEYDVYLDTPVEDMRFSDTPIGVSLSEQLADIYQNMRDFAQTVRQMPHHMIPQAVQDLACRFNEFLSDTICSALRAANSIYQNKLLPEQ